MGSVNNRHRQNISSTIRFFAGCAAARTLRIGRKGGPPVFIEMLSAVATLKGIESLSPPG